MTLRPSDPCISIAELFHENTKETKEAPRVPTIDKADLRALNGWRWGFAACPAVALPPCEASDGERSLSSLLKSRRSVRRFSDVPMPLGSVGALLSMSAGVTNVDATGLNARAWPSAGGLFPIDLFVCVRSVESVGRGLHAYDPFSHTLHHVAGEQAWDALVGASVGGEHILPDASLVLIFSVAFWRNSRKYGDRGYRYCLLDAGHLAQNFLLASEALGLGACPIGSFCEKTIDALTGADGVSQSACYLIAVGNPETA